FGRVPAQVGQQDARGVPVDGQIIGGGRSLAAGTENGEVVGHLHLSYGLEPLRAKSIGVPSMTNGDDLNDQFLIENSIDDPVVPDADPPQIIGPLKFPTSGRTGINR